MPSITPDLAAAIGAAHALDCPLCPALAGEECVYSTAPVSVPVGPGTPMRPVRGCHAGRLALAGNPVPGLPPAAITWDNGDTPRQPDELPGAAVAAVVSGTVTALREHASDPAPGGRRELYVAGHEAGGPAWCVPPGRMLAGVSAGLLGAIVAAWPTLDFVGCYELLMMLVRASARRRPAGPSGASRSAPDRVPVSVPADAESAALIALKATLAAANGYSSNQLAAKFGLTRAQVARVRQLAAATANGHAAAQAPPDGPASAPPGAAGTAP